MGNSVPERGNSVPEQGNPVPERGNSVPERVIKHELAGGNFGWKERKSWNFKKN